MDKSITGILTCSACGQEYYDLHFCPELKQFKEGAKPLPPLTETDVRRIVREEIKKYILELIK